MAKKLLVLCYNKGCGQNFDPNTNTEESCLHHPGIPVFHDAYKGWSCCKKKCTDFTEFLNIKGCHKSFHSNVKPEEPQKVIEKSNPEEVIEYKAPLKPELKPMTRPPYNTPLVTLTPKVSNGLREQIASLVDSPAVKKDVYEGVGEVPVGTVCKNNSCNVAYVSPESLETNCIFHPGFPIFHEGLKYWTCCTKRTTDFKAFLDQPGCHLGSHVWHKTTSGEVKCRVDWHQTGHFVIISVYAKKYDPDSSLIQLSPVRLKISLRFPEENGVFESDMELVGVVDVSRSSVQMLATKVEIKLHKAEAVSWSKLEFPSASAQPVQPAGIKIVLPKPVLGPVDLSGI